MANGTAGTVVVGVDGSERSVEALRWAARVAPAYGGRIRAVGAWENPPEYAGFVRVKDRDLGERARVRVEDAVRKAFGGDVPDGLSTSVVFGHPSKVLVRESRDASLLVVGRRGRGGFRGLLMGSVSSACSAHARCPVLVVHDQQPAGGGAGRSS